LTVSIVIVSYRTPVLTRRAAESAVASGAAQVIVVDNASGDDTIEQVRQLEEVAVLCGDSNVGFGSAANRGARLATRDVILFLNSDAVLARPALAALTHELGRHRERAIVGPRLVEPDGRIQRSAGLLPAPLDLSIRALGLHSVARWLPSIPLGASVLRRLSLAREHASAESATETIDTNMVSGACFAIGREAFWELGGFDERFFMYFEDADLCKRAAAAGMPIRYVPSAVVTHIGGASSEGDYHFSPMHARSMRQYLEKWWGSPGAALAILLLWLRLVGHAMVLHPGTGKALAALRAALRP